ncbi:cytochrome c [Candidatus Gracilibacteria bacterium]|nr:cytochrome c [Candidatus Gracilibacteria bacterium]
MLYQRFLFALLLLLSACAGSAAPTGDAERGRQLFNGEQSFTSANAPVCANCHFVRAEDGVMLGPNLAGVASAAGTRVVGQSAEQYLRTTLLDPDAYLVEGFQEGIMYRGYEEALTQQEVSDLIAYLLTLQ